MSQLNTANQSSPNFYNLGRGKLFFSALTNGIPSGGWRDLGNAPAFSVSSEEETLEHKSSQSGLATTDKKVTISRTTNVSFDLDEISFDNLADWFSGNAEANVTALANTTAYADEVILGTGAHNGDPSGPDMTSYSLDKWYEIYDSSGNRVYGIPANAVIEDGATTADEGTDYRIDRDAGLIMIISGGKFLANDPVTLTVTMASTVDEVRAFEQGSVTGALKFVSVNPANNDDVREWQFHQVTLSSDGDLSLIGDEFTTMSFTGVVEKNEAADADSPYVTIRGLGA